VSSVLDCFASLRKSERHDAPPGCVTSGDHPAAALSAALYAVDHVFICTDTGAPQAQRLIDFGLTEGPANTHPGQGTANRRFFFRSTMLELLWVSDAEEARAPGAAPTLLWERWSNRRSGACPFGIALRGSAAVPPFRAWDYEPAYLPPGLRLQIATDASVSEPMWVYMPAVERASRGVRHSIAIEDITAVRIVSPAADTSRVTVALAARGLVALTPGPAYLLELEFDGGGKRSTADFRPDLPLVIHW
jgi:hypothetical protein